MTTNRIKVQFYFTQTNERNGDWREIEVEVVGWHDFNIRAIDWQIEDIAATADPAQSLYEELFELVHDEWGRLISELMQTAEPGSNDFFNLDDEEKKRKRA